MRKLFTLFGFALAFIISKFFDIDLSPMAGLVVMGDITNADRRGREDLSAVIDVLKLTNDDMKYLSFVNFLPSIFSSFGKKVTAQKHEWIDDAARSEQINVATGADGAKWDTNNIIAAMPMVTAECNKLRVGDVLLLDQDEVVVVKAVNTAAQTIDLYSRGWGSTTAAVMAHDSAHTLEIIGNAQIENGDPIDSNFTTETECYNYCQIFEDVAQISKIVKMSDRANGDELNRQVIKKTKEMLKNLNRALVEGIKHLDTGNKVGTLGGLREFITNTSNVGGALTTAKLYTAITSHANAGLFPSAIHGSLETIGDIEQLYQGAVRTEVTDLKAGTKVSVLCILGHEIILHADKHVRSTEALILDYNRIGYGPLEGGQSGVSGHFTEYPIYDKINGKQDSSQIVGVYTMRVSNGGGTRMYGIS